MTNDQFLKHLRENRPHRGFFISQAAHEAALDVHSALIVYLLQQKKRSHVWVVEMQEKGNWVPTVGTHLSRSEARRSIKDDWQLNMPNAKFRVRKYIQE